MTEFVALQFRITLRVSIRQSSASGMRRSRLGSIYLAPVNFWLSGSSQSFLYTRSFYRASLHPTFSTHPGLRTRVLSVHIPSWNFANIHPFTLFWLPDWLLEFMPSSDACTQTPGICVVVQAWHNSHGRKEVELFDQKADPGQ